MNVTVNDKAVQTLETDAPSGAGLDTLLDNLKKCGAIPPDEVVVSLEVNGRTWSSKEMDHLEATHLQDVAQIAVVTAGVRDYGIRVLQDAASMLDVLREGAHGVARAFREDTPQKANSQLFLLLDAVHSFFGCLFRVTNICTTEQTTRQDRGRLMQRVTLSLEAIQACQEEQNWDALADRLETDLISAIDECADMVRRLQEEIQDVAVTG